MKAIATANAPGSKRAARSAAALAAKPGPPSESKPDPKSARGPADSLIRRIGCQVSEKVADVAANPLVQLGFVAVCLAWFALGQRVDVLTAILSILAITLTQMVLNKQNERESDAHRRDVALHAKLDELVHASKRARDEIAGIEDLEEEEIERLRRAATPVEPAGAGKPAPASPPRGHATRLAASR